MLLLLLLLLLKDCFYDQIWHYWQTLAKICVLTCIFYLCFFQPILQLLNIYMTLKDNDNMSLRKEKGFCFAKFGSQKNLYKKLTFVIETFPSLIVHKTNFLKNKLIFQKCTIIKKNLFNHNLN